MVGECKIWSFCSLVGSIALGFNTSLLSFPAQAIDFRLSDTQTEDRVLLWNDSLLKAISNTRYGPTVVSRAFGRINTSIYNAWAVYDPQAITTSIVTDFQVEDREIAQTNKQESISYAAYNTLVDLFPTQKQLFDNLMVDLGYDPNNRSQDLNTAAGIGNYIAAKTIDFMHEDGSNQLNNYADTIGYQPVNTWNHIEDPNRWQPLSLNNGQTVQTFLTPHWGNVTSFAIDSPDNLLPPPPSKFGTQEYIDRALEVIEISANLSDEEKVIAEYWADGPGTVLPPGHWNLIGQYVSIRDNLDLDRNVRLFFMLGNAAMDGGISAWNTKTHYDYIRPISAIRYLSEHNLLPVNNTYVRINTLTQKTEILAWAGPNLGSQWIEGGKWLPYQKISFVTPPFAEYISGHSTFSASAAEILKRFTNSDIFEACHTQPANSSTFENNIPQSEVKLCWDTFTSAAQEAGISRLYGGIHFADGNIQGQIMGKKVGDAVWERANFYIEGGKQVPEANTGISLLSWATVAIWLKRKSRS